MDKKSAMAKSSAARSETPESAVTRRNFMAGATLGAAAAISFPRALKTVAASTHLAERGGLEAAEPLRLHRNESPYGLAPAAVSVAQQALATMANRYPIEEPKVLQEAIAKHYGVDKEMVALGCGSLEILKMATETFCSAARPAVVAEPTFEAVVSYSKVMHSNAVKVPLTSDHKHDLARMGHAARSGAGMVYLCNPSNPAGTYVSKDEIHRFVRGLPRNTVLLSDEAYFDYVTAADFESCLPYVKDGLPVIVSHTFSKIYGMAGLRVGYAIGRKDLIARMTKRSLGNNPNQIATAAALAALQANDGFVARIHATNAEVRDFTVSQIEKLGLTSIPTQANFMMISMGRPVKPLIEDLKKRKVLVGREFPSMPNHLRISLGTKSEMEQFFKEFQQVLGTGAA